MNGIQRSNGAPPAQKRGFLDLLEGARPQIAAILPAGVDVSRVIQIARTAYLSDPNVQNCSPASILQAVGQAAQMGLEVGKPRNHAYLVPFKDQCTLIIGWQGLVELARRAGLTGSISTRVVYANDGFSLAYDPEPRLQHSPCLEGERGEATHYYAYARLPDGTLDIEVMSRADVDKVRRASRGANSPAWRDWYDEQARKTVLRRLMKRLPQIAELAAAIDHDNRTDGLAVNVTPEAPQPRVSTSDRIRARLAGPTQQTHDETATFPERDGTPHETGIEGEDQ
jgi:recombination protein RecT